MNCPDLIDVNAVRVLMDRMHVDPTSIHRSRDMLEKFSHAMNLLHKQPGDSLSDLDVHVIRNLMETLVVTGR